jgi:ribonuclease P protein component
MKNTIKAHKNFNFENAKTIVTPAIIVKYRKKLHDSGEYGLVVSKKVFPLAVQRNRAKRLMREWIRRCGLPPAVDILLIARKSILEIAAKDGAGRIAKAIKKIRQTNATRRGPATPGPGNIRPA